MHLLLCLALSAAPPTGVPMDFTLRDAFGNVLRLADRRERAVVVVFALADCPLARLYAPRVSELARRFAPEGVGVVLVSPGAQDTAADLAKFRREHGLSVAFLRDTGGVVAKTFGATRSPEAFVLDARKIVRYRGRIDDQYDVGVHRREASNHWLADAVRAVLDGKPVAVPSVPAVGCPLATPVAKPSAGAPTFADGVAAILHRRCATCHHRGGVGPFELLTFDEARSWASAIDEVVESGRMPPWSANPKHGIWANDPTLSAGEKKTLANWIAAGCPEGDRAKTPTPPAFPAGWRIPRVDAVIAMPKAFDVPAEGVVDYQYIRVDPGFTEDKWVTAAQILPGDPAVVHHCNVYLQPPGIAEPWKIFFEGGDMSHCLTIHAQGTPPTILPAGTAKRIPAGWRLIFVVHYQTVGTPRKDVSRLGLTFADPKTVKREARTRVVYDEAFSIPPRDANFTLTRSWTADRDYRVMALYPHMHLRGKSFRYERVRADGTSEILLDVPKYDFAWQHRYEPAREMVLLAGETMRVTGSFDNGVDNPSNPNPEATVQAGPQSWDEMFNGYFDVEPVEADGPGSKAETTPTPVARGAAGVGWWGWAYAGAVAALVAATAWGWRRGLTTGSPDRGRRS